MGAILENDAWLWTSIGLTFAFFVVGALGKGLSRGGWKWGDIYLGLEAALAAMSGAAIYGIELSRKLEGLGPNEASIDHVKSVAALQDKNGKFLVGSILLYFAIASFHLVWEKRNHQPIRQRVALGIVANLLGLMALFTFMLYIKRG